MSDAEFKSDWERTRVQTYFLINIQLDKKNKLSYDKFKNDIWPFFWEHDKTKNSNPESIMSIDEWQKLLNKPIISTKEIGASDNIKV